MKPPSATCWPPKRPAGVQHHLALSIVGIDRSPDNGYLRAKVAQENLIMASGIPYTIVRATQFMEFVGGIVNSGAEGNVVRLSARAVPADRSGRCRRDPGRADARTAAERHHRGRGPGGVTDKRNLRPLIPGRKRRSAQCDPRRGMALLGRPSREDPLVTPGDAPPRLHPLRRVAPPPAGSLSPDTIKRRSAANDTHPRSASFRSPAVRRRLRADSPQPIVSPVMQKDLVDAPGKEMVMLTVEYPPGAVEHIHRHDVYAFVYVREGSIVEGVRGGKEVILTPGQIFYEGPDDVHTVGRNASTTKPAKFLVVMVKKKGVDAVLPAE